MRPSKLIFAPLAWPSSPGPSLQMTRRVSRGDAVMARLIHVHNLLTSSRLCTGECLTVNDRRLGSAGICFGDFSCWLEGD
jgi:hypothetical protein